MEPHLRPRGIAACAEFPNDNPALHRGAIWRCVAVGGEAVCERPVVAPPEEDVRAQVEPTPTEPTVLAPATLADELVEQVTMLVEEVAAMVEPFEAVKPIEVAVVVEPMSASADESVEEPRVLSAVAVESLGEPEHTVPEAGGDRWADEDLATTDEDAAETDDDIDIVDELPFDDVVVEESPTEDALVREDPTGSDPFAVLLRVLEEVARTAGCSEDALIGLRVVMGTARVDMNTLPRASVDALLAYGMLRLGDHGLVRAEAVSREVVAWQGILRGESEDFGACGGAMLDEWCAGLLAKILGSPARVEGLRRDLRGRGVAAFGLLAA
jgi:hypothetical protein